MKFNSLFVPKLLFLAITSSSIFVGAAEYGLDCSFPIHNTTLSCGDLLGDRKTFYEHYMQGCREYYSPDVCDYEEDVRIKMNRRQPQSMVNFTSTGFRKIKAPASLQALLTEFWEKNKDKGSEEEWSNGNIYTNHWEVPTYMVAVGDESLEGGGMALRQAIWEAAEDAIADWTTMKLRPSSLYGIRVYKSGAVLNPHVDRLPLVSSAIVNVAQDVDEPWPIEVYDRNDNAVNITMEPGDMVLYESGSLTHGRPFPLKGRYYANVFIHFEPIDHSDGNEDFTDGDGLPPYIVPNSPEVANWLEQHPNGWSKIYSENESTIAHDYAATGRTDKLRELAQEEPKMLHFEDDNGWLPIHEAVRQGHLETLKFLIDQGADINARTHEDNGPSVFNLAKSSLEPDHPVCVLLEELGAEDWEDESVDDYDFYEDYYYEDYEYGEEEEDAEERDGDEARDKLTEPADSLDELNDIHDEENRTLSESDPAVATVDCEL